MARIAFFRFASRTPEGGCRFSSIPKPGGNLHEQAKHVSAPATVWLTCLLIALFVAAALLGSTHIGSAVPLEELPGKSNYFIDFIGNDPHNWITNVPHYSRIQYKDVYPGIDLVYYGNQQQLEVDFIVAPGANPKSIKFGAVGTQRLERSRVGDLILHTANGEVRLHKPVTYQRINNVQIEIASRFRLTGKNKFNLEISGYDSLRD